MAKNTLFKKDLANKRLHVTREFDAPVGKVWKAWTESELLDKWWAPKPWRAETKTMDFKEGGAWLYRMVGPDGTSQWSNIHFTIIVPGKSFSSACNFCDEHGNTDSNMPAMYWLVEFEATTTGTKVEVELTFDKEADMEKIMTMGFEGGFTMGLGNLDELLAE